MADHDARIDLGIRGLGPAEHIGRGGFADVYRAEQLSLRRTVAVKVLRAQASDPEIEARFERECHAIGAVSDHPHIIGVHEGGFTSNGRAYLVMEYLPGGSLSEHIERTGPLSGEETIDIGIKIGRALGEAHRVGILHRDLKPANIMISAYGEPALGDFGIARIEGGHRTATGVVTASFAHAAPEVLEGQPPTTSADIYSLGSTLYELLVGHGPYFDPTDDSVWPLMKRVMSEPMPSPESVGMGTLFGYAFRRATARNPADRYQNADEFVRDLETAVATPPLMVAPPDGSLAATIPDLRPGPVGQAPDMAGFSESNLAGPVTLDPPPGAATPDLVQPVGDTPVAGVGVDQQWHELYEPPGSGGLPAARPTAGTRSGPRRSAARVLGTIAVAVGGLLFLAVAGILVAGALGGSDEPTVTIAVAGGVDGPLAAETELPITVQGAAAGAGYRPVVDGLATGAVGTEPPVVVLTSGRHSVAVEVTSQGEVEVTEPVEVYVAGDPPPPGYRANLASVAVDGGWDAALATFDRLVADGHRDVQILRSDDSPRQTPGYWNLFVAGFGDDPEAAERYCEEYDLAIPSQCFAGYFDPNA
ncbi:MAG: serine/threonine-protein kinase [Actinomycetota bacterium]